MKEDAKSPEQSAETLTLADARIRFIRDLMGRDRLVEALPALYALLPRSEGSEVSPELSAQLSTWLAECHLRLGQLEAAESLLWRLLAEPAALPAGLRLEALLLRTEAAIRMGQHELATRILADIRAHRAELPAPLAWQEQILQADLLLEQGQAEEALARLDGLAATAPESPDAAARLALRRARALWTQGSRAEAAQTLLRATETLGAESPPLLRAELHLQLGVYAGELKAQGEGSPEIPSLLPAAQHLADAQELFADCGSLEGLERVRQHFARYGRRATDHVVDANLARETETLIGLQRTLSHRLGQLLPLAAQAVPQAPDSTAGPSEEVVALYRDVTRALVQISRRLDRLVTAAHGTVVERNQLVAVLQGLRSLALVDPDAETLVRHVMDLAMEVVEADRGVLALVSRTGELRARESRHFDAGAQNWQLLAERARESGRPVALDTAGGMLVLPEPTERSGSPIGSALAVPIQQGGLVQGVLYLDRQLRQGLLSGRDLALLEVIAAQTGSLLERQRMTWSLHMAARLRETTMEAISDGVLAISPHGQVRSANTHACRLLRQEREAVQGRLLSSIPGLESLFSDPSRLPELDGQVVHLPGGEVVLGVRPVRDDSGTPAGFVLTCTGMKRAQRTAQRIVGARARYTFDDILGRDPGFREQVALAEAAARSDSGVLITGESGTGKEVLAQAIHNGSRRRDGPFVGINCAAIPRDLLESELFGHEEGAFTGSRRGGQPGKFELAQEGTILLDEIAEMPLEMQAKLLRVLQERRFQRVGGSREYLLRARIIATTNQDLEQLATEQRFRSDLLFRLQVIHLQLPPLRERKEDIPLFVEHFLRRSAQRLGKRVRRVAPHVLEAFVDYAWPGNVRELEYVVESEINLAPPDVEELESVPAVLRPARRKRRETLVDLQKTSVRKMQSPSGSLKLQDVEREVLIAALREHRGSVPAVAKSLGVSRGTVYNKVKRYDLDLRAFRHAR